MSQIPPELHQEILLRLPVESLLRFRTACKEWRRTIDSSAFIKSHLHVKSCSAAPLIVRNHLGTRLYSLNLSSDFLSSGTITIPATPLHGSDFLHELPFLPVASCNGLILISHRDRAWGIWNPFRREYHRLPPCNVSVPNDTMVLSGGLYGTVINDRFWRFGFGYDSVGDDYKIVRIEHVLKQMPKTIEKNFAVYSIKMGSWRKMDPCPLSVSWVTGHGLYLNGTLHWVCAVQRGKEELMKEGFLVIVAIDLGTDEYRLLSLPTEVSDLKDHMPRKIDVLGGCLFLSCTNTQKRLDGWIMNDSGDANLWTKLFSFTQLDIIGVVGDLMPLIYLRSKGLVLFEYGGGEFFWFDVEKRTAKKMTIHGFPDSFSCQNFQASLVRPNSCANADGNSAAEERTERIFKHTNERLKITLTTTDVSED